MMMMMMMVVVGVVLSLGVIVIVDLAVVANICRRRCFDARNR